jgi:hypothetical protein
VEPDGLVGLGCGLHAELLELGPHLRQDLAVGRSVGETALGGVVADRVEQEEVTAQQRRVGRDALVVEGHYARRLWYSSMTGTETM